MLKYTCCELKKKSNAKRINTCIPLFLKLGESPSIFTLGRLLKGARVGLVLRLRGLFSAFLRPGNPDWWLCRQVEGNKHPGGSCLSSFLLPSRLLRGEEPVCLGTTGIQTEVVAFAPAGSTNKCQPEVQHMPGTVVPACKCKNGSSRRLRKKLNIYCLSSYLLTTADKYSCYYSYGYFGLFGLFFEIALYLLQVQ